MKRVYKIIPQKKFKDSILIEKYADFHNIQMAIGCFYVDYKDITQLIDLLSNAKKSIGAENIKQEENIYPQAEYIKQRELLIFEERYEEVIILDKVYKPV